MSQETVSVPLSGKNSVVIPEQFFCLWDTVPACSCLKSYRYIPAHPDAPSKCSDYRHRCFSWRKKAPGLCDHCNGALHPGAAIHKQLPSVGHIHITGIVNVSGVLEQLTLQTTRLSTVIFLADKIVQGILESIPLSKTDFKQIL